MSFQPILPMSGYQGWRFLSASLENQMARTARDPAQARDMTYFREKIGSVTSAEGLVSDFRLLRVALSAFGLQDDLPNRAFIRKVLSESVTDDRALMNRLADKRYRAFSEAFGFGGPQPPKTTRSGFAEGILSRFQRQTFERAVGEQNPDMRLALTAQRELADLSTRNLTDNTSWLSVLGNPPLRAVFETAFGLPKSIGTVDLDLQLSAFRKGAQRVLGSSSFEQFREPEKIEAVIRAFTLRSEASAGPSPLTRGFGALIMLRGNS